MAGGRGILGAGGGFGTGLLLLVGGLIVKHAQANVLAECSGGMGQFGSALDPNVAAECSSARDLSSMATGAIWIGAIMLVIAVGGFLIFLVAAASVASARKSGTAARKPGTAVPGPGNARAARSAPGAAGGLPAGESAVAQPAQLSGVRPGRLQADWPGPGCGHEMRPGALFCTMCGRPAADSGRPDAVPGGQPVPPPDPGVTAVIPVPAPPDPVGPVSPATTTAWLPGRPSRDPGRSSELGWTEPRPASGGDLDASPPWGQPYPLPAAGQPYGSPAAGQPYGSPAAGQPYASPAPGSGWPGDDGARGAQGHRRRSRWPLLAGTVALLAVAGAAAVVFVVHPFQKSQAGPAAASPASSPAVRQPLSVSAKATPSSSSQSSQQQSAQSLGALLAQSVSDRRSIVNAVNSVSRCGPALSQAPQVFENAAASRQRLLARLASLPGRSALPSQMFDALNGAWRASARADQDFARWAQDELSQGCSQNDQSDPGFQAAAGPDSQATADKKAFARTWNPLAAEYGLTPYQWDQL